jgi:hypothetical protein
MTLYSNKESKMNHYFFTANIIVLFVAFGCTPSVFNNFEHRAQIMEVQSTNCINDGKILQYENDTIRVGYMFWSDGGTMGLYIHNKLNRPIYIDWKRTSFVAGSTKNDYWDENVTMKERGTSGGSSMRIMGMYLNNSSFSSITKLTKSERITFLPPGTTIEKTLFRITDNLVALNKGIPKDTLLMLKQSQWLTGKYYYDKTTLVRILIQKYTEETSPLKFHSFITYSLDEKFSNEAYVNSPFYISKIIQIPFWAFDAKRITDAKEEMTQNIWITPNSFYLQSGKIYSDTN